MRREVFVLTTILLLACAARGPITVTEYGAKGDGKTDDTAAIQAAFADLRERSGGDVLFPRGTYRVAFPDQVPAYTSLFTVGSNTRVLFANGARIRVAPVASDGRERGVLCSVFGVDQRALPVSKIEFRGVTIEQTAVTVPAGTAGVIGIFLGVAADAGSAFNPDQVTDVQIVRPRLDALASGIYVVQRSSASPRAPGTWSDARQVRQVRIADAEITRATGSGITADGKDIEISNATISAAPDATLAFDGISIHSGLDVRVKGGALSGFSGDGNAITIRNNRNSLCGTRGVLVDGTTFRANAPRNGAAIYVSSAGMTGTGEDVFGVDGVTIRGCTFDGGSHPLAVTYGLDPVVPIRNVVFEANEAVNTSGGPAITGTAALPIQQLSVTKNVLRFGAANVPDPALHVVQASRASIVGNTITFEGPTVAAPLVLEDLHESTVSDNTVTPPTAGGAAAGTVAADPAGAATVAAP